MRLPPPWIAAFVLAGMLGPQARAQAWSDPGFGVGVDALYTRGDSAAKGSASVGLHTLVRFTGVIGIEGSVVYRTESLEAGGIPVLALRQVPVSAGVQFYLFASGRVQPFLFAGAAYCWTRVEGVGPNADTGTNTEHQFAFQGGAGLELRPSRRTAIRLSARRTFLQLDGAREASARFGTDVSPDFLSFRAGFTYYF